MSWAQFIRSDGATGLVVEERIVCIGDHPAPQLTYDTLRETTNGETIAKMISGMWWTDDKGHGEFADGPFSDVHFTVDRPLSLIEGSHDAPADMTIRFVRDDFEGILRGQGIDPDTVTVHEWRKYTDSFLDGTAWSEVAALACDRIKAERTTMAGEPS